ncbi:L-cystine transporter [Aerococcus kribbianus]|uniref:L-cystine uptake protein TcyP n=1 Tax=Aerococcus kribbianus TaxID=2999064 RepID=A0A9X3FXC9_9LACT|nr:MULTISPECIES: cation:dicarboxylase symporter family transporter [unclassified Aerococcus]MCZ0717990.1 cation:dicarboxylase symporter family transporter [Aerococcus sp. YH-aer221]MCZ0726277.1 cation:dicarboxylase symporter family transporter [Aerococcus sp. YH-aer222]
MSVVLTLLVFLIGLYALNQLAKKHVKYSNRVFIGLGMGIVFGAIIQLLFQADSDTTTTIIDWVSVVGSGYVRLLQMLVTPLIFVSLVRAFTTVQGENNIGKIGSNVLTTLIITVAIASFIGLATTVLFNLDGATLVRGDQEIERIAQIKESQSELVGMTLPQQLLSFLPTNVFEDFAGLRPTSNIGVVVFSSFIGVAYLGVARKQPELAATFKNAMDALHAIVMRIVTLILRIAPYGIFALMTKAVATASFESLKNMGIFVVASYVAFAIMFIIHGLILAIFKVNPIDFFKKAWNTLSFAFTSRSSAGALPLTIATQSEAMGVDETTANFSSTFGLSIGQNGCAGIYPTMLVAVVAPTVGMDLSDPMTWLTIIGIVTISSLGVAGVGGGATFASLIVFGALGLPVEIIGLMVSIEPIIDMGRTALNVNDSMIAGVVSARLTKSLDDDVMKNPDKQVAPEAL